MNYKIDLHTHTNISDGASTPKELIEAAVIGGVKAIALTDHDEVENEIKYLVSLGLDGIEKYYPSFKENDYKFINYLINKYNLIYSGGTDYHGANRPDIKIGSGKDNSLLIPYSIYENIVNLIMHS